MRRVVVVALAVVALTAAAVYAQPPLPTPPYTPAQEPGVCAWYGECGFTIGRDRKPLNCIYNGPAKPVRHTCARAYAWTLV
jgi:hypothetical protein